MEIRVPLKTTPHGAILIDGTRVTLDSIIYSFQDGRSAEEIAECYPSVKLEDIYLIIAYYLKHKAEIDDYLKRREQEAAEVRRMNEQQRDPSGVREHLMARRGARGQSELSGDGRTEGTP